MNYLYSKIECDANFRCDTPLRKAFRKHLEKVTQALHDIEWVDSGDYGAGQEEEAINACLAKGDVLQAAIDEVEKSISQYREELAKRSPCATKCRKSKA